MTMRVLSGIQPSGRLHLGNYFGAMKPQIELQEAHDCFYFIATYHALTSLNDGKLIEEYTREVALGYLALGLDPRRTVFYRQTDVPEVTELTYIDKVHLLTVLDQQGVMTGGLREEYSQDATFRDLVTRIAQYLDPSARGYKAYQDLAGQVTGQGTLGL